MRLSKTRAAKFPRRLCASVLVVALVLAGLAAVPPTAAALSVHRIMSDSDFFDGDAMSATRIQSFLVRHGSFLAGFTVTEDGSQKRAADIIAEVSRRYRLSPKFFLTLLEKEQSLITDPTPSEHQLDYALGYGCPSSCSPTYRGFAKQLRSAAQRIREDYLPALELNRQFNGWGPGIPKLTIDDVLVTPANVATAVLYIYNPYVGKYGGGDERWGANSLFLLLWTKWFIRQHPDGTLLRVSHQPGIWLIRNGKRLPFTSRTAFFSNYDYSKVITVDRDEVETYELGPAIRYPEPSILQLTTGGVYLLANGVKRPLASKETLRVLGYNPEEIIRGVKESELEAYPKGPTITERDAFPTGRLLQSKSSGGIVFVDPDGVRHAIYSREIYRSQFRGQRPERVNDAVIAAFTEGDPVKFRDGEIVAARTERRVYFISNGERRPVPDGEVFQGLGFKFKNLVWTNDRSLNVHPLGAPLSDLTSAQE